MADLFVFAGKVRFTHRNDAIPTVLTRDEPWHHGIGLPIEARQKRSPWTTETEILTFCDTLSPKPTIKPYDRLTIVHLGREREEHTTLPCYICTPRAVKPLVDGDEGRKYSRYSFSVTC